MNMIDKIILYCKNLLKKTKKIQMLEATIEIDNESKNNKFKKTLKVNTSKTKKTKIETLTCYGDGLGIQKKMSY